MAWRHLQCRLLTPFALHENRSEQTPEWRSQVIEPSRNLSPRLERSGSRPDGRQFGGSSEESSGAFSCRGKRKAAGTPEELTSHIPEPSQNRAS
eukprot:scaffold201780_cov23-Tisochrysis_lutea.AAC.2